MGFDAVISLESTNLRIWMKQMISHDGLRPLSLRRNINVFGLEYKTLNTK